MPKLQILPLAALALASGASSQDCPRTEYRLSSGRVTTSALGFDAWRIAAPKEVLPPDTARGLVATARLSYAIWPDRDANGNATIGFAKSVDGGWSWGVGTLPPIWTANSAVGESFDASTLELHAEGHLVFVTVVADRDANGAPNPTQNDSCWILGSKDQGQTWQAVHASRGINATLSTGDRLLDVDVAESALAGGRCHVVYEADYAAAVGQGGAPSQAHDIWYQAAGFDAAGNLVLAFAEEKRLSTSPSGTIDSDTPFVAADGLTVALGWQDTRNGLNDTISRISADGGTTLGAEVNHTNFVAAVSLIRRSRAAVDGPNVYVLMEDSRRGVGGDDITLDISNDGGATFTFGTKVSQSPANIDSDGSAIWAENGNVVVAYIDDRQGSGNVDNDVYAVVDHNAGADFIAGTALEHLVIDTPTNCVVYRIDGYGEVVAIAAETSDFPEDARIAFSSTTGDAWRSCALRRNNVADVDDLDTAVTINRDITAIWQDDQNLGNTANHVYVRGLKLPFVTDLSATNQGFRMTGASPADTGGIAFLLPSLTAPLSNATPIDLPAGLALNFTADAATFGAFANLPAFYSFIDAQGEAAWAFPNFATVLGVPIHWCVFSIAPLTSAWSRAYSDTITQNP
ncbi:MAG: hypothetical protein IT457_21780 [Planctomycetes bacterium]|nr:hypothetical protein [Planctomycetota bacterium]